MSSAYINIMEQNLRVLQCLLMRLSRAKILLKAYIQVKKAIFKINEKINSYIGGEGLHL